MKTVKNTLTPEESKAAVELQRPIQSEDKPALPRANTFQQLAKVSRDSRLVFGNGAAQWAQPGHLFDESYRNGLESAPFYITRAWRFKSKSGFGERLGIEIVLSNARIYSVALPWNDADEKRKDILAMFSERNAPPLGPLCMKKLPKDKGNDYYDIAPFESGFIPSSESIEVPFVEINESEVPF